MARYPQVYSRVGFVHHYRTLDREEQREIVEQQVCAFGGEEGCGGADDLDDGWEFSADGTVALANEADYRDESRGRSGGSRACLGRASSRKQSTDWRLARSVGMQELSVASWKVLSSCTKSNVSSPRGMLMEL